jgi:hypothetical protein
MKKFHILAALSVVSFSLLLAQPSFAGGLPNYDYKETEISVGTVSSFGMTLPAPKFKNTYYTVALKTASCNTPDDTRDCKTIWKKTVESHGQESLVIFPKKIHDKIKAELNSKHTNSDLEISIQKYRKVDGVIRQKGGYAFDVDKGTLKYLNSSHRSKCEATEKCTNQKG